jgi:hypothetical protein
MHMYSARKTVLQNRAITRILKGEMCFATETRLASKSPMIFNMVAEGIGLAQTARAYRCVG